MSDINDEAVKSAARIIVNSVLDLLQADPHAWSDRPCETCRVISTLVDKPFGCYKYQQRHKQNS